ncbi:MAG: hypothetical protein JWM56_1225 [Candidatus Peribacteria bacterium]|nr:hypothetical protein [Candidatus Peribacteria bacterium]
MIFLCYVPHQNAKEDMTPALSYENGCLWIWNLDSPPTRIRIATDETECIEFEGFLLSDQGWIPMKASAFPYGPTAGRILLQPGSNAQFTSTGGDCWIHD